MALDVRNTQLRRSNVERTRRLDIVMASEIYQATGRKPVQIVLLPSSPTYCCRISVGLQIDTNTTGLEKKIWTGRLVRLKNMLLIA